MTESNIPRRRCVTKMVPSERAIRDAMLAVERMGDDERLTNAVILLGKAQDAVADYVDEMTASAPGDTLLKEDLAAIELDLNCGIRPHQLDVHRLIATCRYHMQRADSLDYQYRVVCKGVGIEPVSCELVAAHARAARAPRIAACDIDAGTIIDPGNTEPLQPFGECGHCPEWSEVREVGSGEGVCCCFLSPHNGNGRRRDDKPCFDFDHKFAAKEVQS